MNGNEELDPAAAQAWRDYDRGMSALARQDAYRQGDPFERAAIRRQATGLRAPEQRPESSLSGEFLIPKSGFDYGLMMLGGPLPRAAKAAVIGGMGALFEPSEAQARMRKLVTGAGDMLRGRQRTFSPGIYKNPRVIAEEAAAQVAPEHPALKNLFGVSREDLWEIGERGTRKGNIEPQYAMPAKVGGSYVAENVMTPANARRMIDTLTEAQRFPQLIHGMDAWYVMDPAYQRMVQLVGPEKATQAYQRFNTVVPMFSPGSDVLTEINRGTAANMMIERGLWPQFQKYGGLAAEKRGANFPAELRDVIGHPYHSTAQAGPVNRYLQSGTVEMTKPKVPLYMQASGVPETGFQTRLPVPDAHWTRGVGAADVRMSARPGKSIEPAEYHQLGPWYRENVAAPLGIEAVPAQARQWGVLAPQTGVDTPVGAPKLELLAQKISERAQKLGVDPQKLRDDVLMGKEHALWIMGIPTGAATMSGIARQDQYQP